MTAETGKTSQIESVSLVDGYMRLSVLNYGAVTQGWWYKETPLILGFDDPRSYLTDTRYLGAIVGRVANRIEGARFDFDGARFGLSANEGENTLHGGTAGLSKQVWDLEKPARNEVLISYVSCDGEGGFPAEIRFEVRVRLHFPRLTYSITAQPDRPTPISLAQHNYYTLGSAKGVDDFMLGLASNRYLELGRHGIPTGRVALTDHTELDFSASKPVGSAAKGIDHYFCFDPDRDPHAPVAELAGCSGLTMTVYSDQPGAQVYSGYKMAGSGGASRGVCIEPSGYPNAPNTPSFPSIIYTPDNPYRQELILKVTGGPYAS